MERKRKGEKERIKSYDWQIARKEGKKKKRERERKREGK